MKHALTRALPESVDSATSTDLLDVYAEPTAKLKTGRQRNVTRPPVQEHQAEPYWNIPRSCLAGRPAQVDPRVRVTAPDGTVIADLRARDAYDLANRMIVASYAALEG